MGRTPQKRPGLLNEDLSEIRVVPDAHRAWWDKLSTPARARFANRHGKKWTDAETRRLVVADPDREDYYNLAAEMGRAPGALRTRRSQMIHLIREEYGYPERARLYHEDPKAHHKWADVGQVDRILRELGVYALPVSHQWPMARHLKQPSESWRGDNSSAVLRERRQRAEAVMAHLAALRAGATTGT